MTQTRNDLLGLGADSVAPRRLRPDPIEATVEYPFISVDDHLTEPPTTFEGRLPAKFADSTPRVVTGKDGGDYWLFEDKLAQIPVGSVAAGWEPDDWFLGPINLTDARPGTWQLEARIKDMDVAGVLASLNFPSGPFGFAGQVFMRMKDQDLGLACMRAYNDWICEEWMSPHPDRIIGCGVTWLPDVELAAAEIRRNAERGFTAVSFTENPSKLGLPSIHSGYWDPFFAACEETQTVINLHIGSSSETIIPSPDSPPPVEGALFPMSGLISTVDWLYSRVGVRFPDIKVAISEGGIGWVPLLLDRLRYQINVGANNAYSPAVSGFWNPDDPSVEEVLHRNFWFTTYFDPSAFTLRHDIGIGHIMLESDYPHPDSTWPDSQAIIGAQIGTFPQDEIDRFTWRNAAELYRHEVTLPQA